MEIELQLRSIPCTSQQHLVISYKGHRLPRKYIADLVCFEQVIVELKALDRLSGKDEAQI
jgi:GxxExxY protein